MEVDVAVNYYGKPYQTLLAIDSLLEHSDDHIDRIYVVEEREQPRQEESLADLLARYGDRVKRFTPAHYLGWRPAGLRRLRSDPEMRLSVRYQYPLEVTDKPYLFVTHNDMVFTGDLVAELLARIQEGHHAGAGLIGQCWNCPAHTAGICNHDRQRDLHLSYFQAVRLAARVLSPRTRPHTINFRHPLPLPECRLNEFAALIDVEVYRRESIPVGSSPPLGCSDGGLDTGSAWFRSMVNKGYSFADVNIWDYCRHGTGHPDLTNPERYEAKESEALSLLRARGVL